MWLWFCCFVGQADVGVVMLGKKHMKLLTRAVRDFILVPTSALPTHMQLSRVESIVCRAWGPGACEPPRFERFEGKADRPTPRDAS